MKKCNEVMTKDPVCCLPSDLVSKAADLMKRERVGSIPVVESEKTKKLVGIITDRDLTMRIVAEGLDAQSTKVETVMTRKVVTCSAEDNLQNALTAMAENQLRRIPIVGDNYEIIGIISQADIALQGDHPKRTAAMVKEISQSSGT